MQRVFNFVPLITSSLKKLILILTLLLAVHQSKAQKLAGSIHSTNSIFFSNNSRNCIDTITDFFDGATPSIYAAPNGGFVSGNNGYNDTEKLQLFNHFGNYSITGVWIWFGRKTFNSNNPASTLEIIVKHTDSTASNIPPFIKGPSDSVLAVQAIPVQSIIASDLPTIGLNYIAFDNPVLIRDGYAIGISMNNLEPGDTIAIYSSSDGDPNQARRSWERWDGVYGTILDNWELNIDLAIFPIVDCELNNISELKDQTKYISSFPNPASDIISIAWNEHENLNYTIVDVTGKTIQTGVISNQNNNHINISSYSSGLYFFVGHAHGKKYFSRFVKK